MRRRKASSVNQRRAWTVQQLAVLDERFGQGVLAGPGLEPGDEQGGGDVAEFQGPADADQVVPVFGDEVDLGVVVEEGTGFRPGAVVPGRVGSPEAFLGQLGDAGRQAQADQVEEGEGGQGLAVAVGGVLDDGQLGGVAEDLVEGEGGVSFGGDDDLGSVGGVLIGDMGVARHSLVQEIPRQRSRRKGPAPHRQAQPVGGRQGASTPGGGEGIAVVGVDDGGVGRPQGLLAQIPLGGPVQGVDGDPGELGHAGRPVVARLGEDGGVEVPAVLQGGQSRRGAAGVGQMGGEAGLAVDLDQQLRQR